MLFDHAYVSIINLPLAFFLMNCPLKWFILSSLHCFRAQPANVIPHLSTDRETNSCTKKDRNLQFTYKTMSRTPTGPHRAHGPLLCSFRCLPIAIGFCTDGDPCWTSLCSCLLYVRGSHSDRLMSRVSQSQLTIHGRGFHCTAINSCRLIHHYQRSPLPC